MSWDIFVQNWPADVKKISDIPRDFVSKPFLSRAQVEGVFREVFPSLDVSNPVWWQIECDEFDIEVNIDLQDPTSGFAMYVRGGPQAVSFIDRMLKRLDVRAADAS